jgi:cathepsin X
VSEYGLLKGEDKIMNEVYQRGPVACSIYAEQQLDDYKGGIFTYNGTEK